MTTSVRIPFFGTLGGDEKRARDDQAIVTDLEALLKSADGVRKNAEVEWYNNFLMVEGNQYQEAIVADVTRHRKIPIEVPGAGGVKYVDNWCYALMRQALAQLREGRSRQVAVEATSDEKDVRAASVANLFLGGRDTEDNEADKSYTEFGWGMLAGGCARYSVWDAKADGKGRSGVLRGAGDISSITLSPFQYHLAPWLNHDGSVPWVIISEIVDVDEVNDLFPGKEVQEEEYAEVAMYLDRMAGSITGAPMQTIPKRKHAVVRHQMLCAPTNKYPKGRVFLWAGNKLLQPPGDLPEGKMPLEFFDWFRIPGRIYPMAFITPIRDTNRQANKVVSQLIELKDRQLRGDMALYGDGAVTEETDEETGAKRIRVPYGSQFQWVTYDLRTSEADILLARFWNAAMGLAGLHEPTLGKSTAGMPTASHVLMLREQDTAGLGLFRIGYDLTYSRISSMKLLLARNHYKMPRLARTVGSRNKVNVGYFLGSDLRSTEDVRPRPAPLISEAQRAVIRQELQAPGRQAYGPYAGPDDMLAKMQMILSSGLPNADDEVADALGDITINDLRKVVNALNRKKIALAMTLADTANEGAVLQRISLWMEAENRLNNVIPQQPPQGLPGGQQQLTPGQSAAMVAG